MDGSGPEALHYREHGYFILRGLIPDALLRDVRRVCDGLRPKARELGGSEAQRIQPLAQYTDDLRAFTDLRELPRLAEAIAALAGHGFEYVNPLTMGCFYEPERLPWCTGWHRDTPGGVEGEARAEMHADERLYHQCNVALYQDSCTWYVPGSHRRPVATPDETAAASAPLSWSDCGDDVEAREREALAYCQRMPGAVRIHLDAGDFMLYRNTALHLGAYVPYAKRATLHDFVVGDAYREWLSERHGFDLARLQTAGARG